MKGIGIYLGAPLVHPKPPGPKPPMFNVQFRGLACYGQRFGFPQKIGGEEGMGKPTVQHSLGLRHSRQNLRSFELIMGF